MEVVSSKPWNSLIPDLLYYYFFPSGELSSGSSRDTLMARSSCFPAGSKVKQREKYVQAYLGEEEER